MSYPNVVEYPGSRERAASSPACAGVIHVNVCQFLPNLTGVYCEEPTEFLIDACRT
ncbi:hypothetical protein GLAREA_07387 [Glarea lozoyensis ATCC 20868]|uniref:Uncharacterized protein n=1 Tax=Glarea lozoyensis (strain ATCC 20868 / MF5171) TaxID=1116229 RepID=S3D594_GLAL2|nr:uncharacterized protein GLAREA_07387 [Glarea lozoyensis ATCC 20868]EPE32254.1 hypothetical protein GLAREA_07387 [Glarea lozoyensis ATCC 20868]